MTRKTKDTSVAFSLTKDINAIAKMTSNLRVRNEKLMHDAHVTAVSCILHVVFFKNDDGVYTGSCSIATQLLSTVRRDKRAAELLRWFLAYGPFHRSKRGQLMLDKKKLSRLRALGELELLKRLREASKGL